MDLRNIEFLQSVYLRIDWFLHLNLIVQTHRISIKLCTLNFYRKTLFQRKILILDSITLRGILFIYFYEVCK